MDIVLEHRAELVRALGDQLPHLIVRKQTAQLAIAPGAVFWRRHLREDRMRSGTLAVHSIEALEGDVQRPEDRGHALEARIRAGEIDQIALHRLRAGPLAALR